MKKVFIIILHFKGKEFTRKCLLSLAGVKTKGFSLKVVLVDNASVEPILDLKKDFPKVVFLKNEQNLGFAEGNNVGIRYALENEADFVLLLNNDTTVDKNFLLELVKTMEKDEEIGLVTGKIYFAPGFEYHKTKYKSIDRGKVFWYAGGKIDWQNILCSHRGVDEVDKGQYNKQVAAGFISGCVMLIKREVLEKIGLLDKRYFLYLEDVEFCQRARKAGFKIIFQPKAKVWHFNASSSEVGGDLHDYFITRNRLLFGMKYASLRTKFNLFQESVRLLLVGRSWQKKGVLDFYVKKLAKGSWRDKK